MNIWVPKFKIQEAEIAAPNGRAVGYFMIEACNRYGQVKRQLGPWKQLITNQAMIGLAYQSTTGGYHNWCHVGIGAPTFTFSSTGLGNPVASTSTVQSSSDDADLTGANGYRVRQTVTNQFGLGDVVANLTEVGFFNGSGASAGGFLDLIRDPGGNPTTFPVTADDQLRVTHIIDRYPYLGVTSGSFNIGGAAGSGTHDFEARMTGLGQSGMAGGTGHVFGAANNSSQSWFTGTWRGATGLGDEFSGFTGSPVYLAGQTSSSAARGTYSNDGTNWYTTNTFTYGLGTANHSAGISGLNFLGSNQIASIPQMKIFIDPPIPKYAGSVQRILTLTARYGWTRG